MFLRKLVYAVGFSALLASVAVRSASAAASGSAAEKAVRCSAVFVAQAEAAHRVVINDAFAQWLLWEQTANLQAYLKPTTPIEVPLVQVESKDIKIATLATGPVGLKEVFQNSDGLTLWPKHPYNLDRSVPYQNLPASKSISVWMTSSRSLALTGAWRGYTIKLPTNYPHGPGTELQSTKVQIKDDIDSALLRSSHFDQVDREIGIDPVLIILREVMTLSERRTGSGMVVRDVRPLDDGHYYLPAFSIPNVGREIAKINGKTFDAFFAINYAELLGEAKARLLLRSGMQMQTPNPQNMLIQLDRDLRPTGKIVLRDISDCYLVKSVARGLGLNKQMMLETDAGYAPVEEVDTFWSISSWRLDGNYDEAVDESVLRTWGVAHDEAFLRYMSQELDITLNKNDVKTLNQFLKSDIGAAKLRQYRKSHLISSPDSGPTAKAGG